MKVNLLPRKEFEIVLDDVRLYGKFGTWTITRYCQLKNLPLEVAFLNEENATIPLRERLEDAALLLLCAVEYSFRLKRLAFDYEIENAYDWIDQMGGVMSQDFLAIMAHAGSKDEKKSLENHSPLPNSNKSFSQPAVE